MKTRFIVVLLGFVSWTSTTVPAADWPQWRGPDRTGVSKETGLLKSWPPDGPKLAWKAENLGTGYSTPSVAGGRVYLISSQNKEEFAQALGEKDGKQIWSVKIGKVGPNQGPQYPGSRSTPTIDGDFAYCLSSDGDLVCLETAEGKERWHKQLRSDFDGKPGLWAYAESPLIDGDHLICTPGGATATLVALNKQTGAVVWKSAIPEADVAAYASPLVAEVGGKKQYIQFLHKGVVGVDAMTGKFLWRYNKTIDMAANIPTPVVRDGFVFSSTGRNGAGLTKLTADKDAVLAEQVYYTKELANNIGGVVLIGDYVYGTNGKGLVCMEFATGVVKWTDPSAGTGAVCYAEGNLYLRSEKTGDVALIEASPTGYKEKGRFKQPERSKIQAWPHPIVANGRLYLRDQGVLLCYDVKE